MDGIPNVVIEAMALGIPVVATNSGSISEVVIDQETGLLVEPQDSEALALAISKLLKDAELCNRIAVNARKMVLEKFDYDAQVSRLCSTLGLIGK